MSDRQRSRYVLFTACAVLIAACGPATGRVANAPTATPEAIATVVALSTASDVVPAPPADSMVAGVAADDGEVVLVGADIEGPAVWTHATGQGWQRREVRRPGRAGQLDAVAVDGDRGVAFGGSDGARSHLWVRDGGSDWRVVADDASGIDGRVNAATVDGDRWLAAGERIDPEGGGGYEGVVWASRDGQSFAPLVTGLDLAEGTVSDIVADDGTVVVVGFDVTGGRVWTSSNDDRFTAATGGFGAASLHGVTTTADGFVIIGRGMGDLEPRVWTSTDGRRWDAVELDGRDLTPHDEMHDATTSAGAMLVVGQSPAGGAAWILDGDRLVRAGS